MIVLDIYDDPSMEVLHHALGGRNAPGILKTATPLTTEDLGRLHDHDFALVALDEDGRKIRKFAMVDPGHTAMSCTYFAETHGGLSKEAQASVALELAEACSRFGIPHESLLEIAKEAADIQEDVPDVEAVRQKVYEKYPHLHPEGSLSKTASLQGAITQHWGQPINTARDQDLAEADFLLNGRFPVQNIGDIKTASAYFSEHWKSFRPEERREYCTKLAAIAAPFLVEVGDDVSRYAGSKYAEDAEERVLARKGYSDETLHPVLDKLAASVQVSPLDTVAQALLGFDKLAGIDRLYGKIPDPWETLMAPKLAEYSWVQGAERVTGSDLVDLSVNSLDLVRKQFGDEAASEFAQGPVEYFDALPDFKKILLSRMASDNYSGGATSASR